MTGDNKVTSDRMIGSQVTSDHGPVQRGHAKIETNNRENFRENFRNPVEKTKNHRKLSEGQKCSDPDSA